MMAHTLPSPVPPAPPSPILAVNGQYVSSSVNQQYHA